MSTAAAIAIRRKKMVNRFRAAGAVNADHALPLEALNQRRSWQFNQLVRRGVFVAADENRYFLDEPAAANFFRRHRIRMLALSAVAVSIIVVLWLTGIIGR